MDSIYSKSVAYVPADFNDATSAYKWRLWIAVAGTILFFLTYLLITGWFLYSGMRLAWQLYQGTDYLISSIICSILCLLLGGFMMVAMFIRQTEPPPYRRLVKQNEEPLLFDFIYRLADEIGAPKPHRIYLSNAVNASVFYDLSIWNLIFPNRKDLDIGMGLVNVLSLGEFKAILAHEFGHFAQKSTWVGRWVYIAHQIAISVVLRSTGLDTFISTLKSSDIRISWAGYLLGIFVWAIRAIVESLFALTFLFQKALSREMEFQADLVAVSATGSDALIHALHKLQAADEAFDNAIAAADQHFQQGLAIENIYPIQSNAIEKTALILNDDQYGRTPVMAQSNPESHRIFDKGMAQAPQMWASHPPNFERENNAKKRYLKAEISRRSSWDLFADPILLQRNMTAALYPARDIPPQLQSTDDALAAHNELYNNIRYHARYKGMYLQRFVAIAHQEAGEMVDPNMGIPEAKRALKDLYPDSLAEQLQSQKKTQEEQAQLIAIQHNQLEVDNNGIQHRGNQISRAELPDLIKQLDDELQKGDEVLNAHDQKSRTVHLRLAEEQGLGWAQYLLGLHQLLHFTEHSLNQLTNLQMQLHNVLLFIDLTKDHPDKKLFDLLSACNQMHKFFHTLDQLRPEIHLDGSVTERLGIQKWDDLVEPLALEGASFLNYKRWIEVSASWQNLYSNALSAVHSAAMERLLTTEQRLANSDQNPITESAPQASVLTQSYPLFDPDEEPKVVHKPSILHRLAMRYSKTMAVAKFLLAAAILASTLFLPYRSDDAGKKEPVRKKSLQEQWEERNQACAITILIQIAPHQLRLSN